MVDPLTTRVVTGYSPPRWGVPGTTPRHKGHPPCVSEPGLPTSVLTGVEGSEGRWVTPWTQRWGCRVQVVPTYDKRSRRHESVPVSVTRQVETRYHQRPRETRGKRSVVVRSSPGCRTTPLAVIGNPQRRPCVPRPVRTSRSTGGTRGGCRENGLTLTLTYPCHWGWVFQGVPTPGLGG